jgi:ABC-type multidrug transport system fused ATPase/permease subunit
MNSQVSLKKIILFYYSQIQEKKKLVIFIFLTIFFAITESITIGAALPVISFFVDPEFVYSFKIFQIVLNFFDITDIKNYRFEVLLSFVFIVAFSFIIKFIILRFSIYFCKSVTSDIAGNIFKSSFCKDYSEIIKNSPNQIISGITEKIEKFTYLLFNCLQFLSGSFLTISIIVMLLFLFKPIFIILGIFFIIFLYLMIALTVRRLLLKNSLVASNLANLRIKTLEICFGNIKNILLEGAEEKYAKYFIISDNKYRKSQARVELVAQMPKILLESTVTIVLTIVAYNLLLQSHKSTNLVVYFGVIVFAFQRLLPVFQGIYLNWSLLKGNQVFLVDLMNLILVKKIEQDSTKAQDINFENQIEFCNISFGYNNSSNYIINNFNFVIKKGDKIGIKGVTGGGKTTLINLFTTLLLPLSGRIIVDKKIELSELNYKSWKKKISYVPQEYLILDDTIKNNIVFTLNNEHINNEYLALALKISELDQYVNKLENKIDTMIGERGINLSGGQRQRIAIARAIYKYKEILIFDEATSSLDYQTENKIFENIKKYLPNTTFVMITHREQTLSHVDKVIDLNDYNTK